MGKACGVRGCYARAGPRCGAARRNCAANPAGGPNCVVETGVRDALPPLRWAAGFSRSGSGIPLITYLARASHVLTKNVVMAGRRQVHVGCAPPRAGPRKRRHPSQALSLKRIVELAVIDTDPAVLRGAEHVHIAMAETNLRMFVGFPRMDGLRCNNIIPRNHHD